MSSITCPYCGADLHDRSVKICPACGTDASSMSGPMGTRLLTAQDIMDSIAEVKKTPTRTQKSRPAPVKKKENCRAFRPLRRPSMAIICLYHDGLTEGEEYAVRADRCTLGREDADIVVPHDSQISGLHAVLSRELENGEHHWYMTDQSSTNGTFGLIGEGVLRDRQELLLGSRRYRFQLATSRRSSRLPPDSHEVPGNPEARAFLVEMPPKGKGVTYEILQEKVNLGSDSHECSLAVTGDPYLSPCHASIERDRQGRWVIKPIDAFNGVWVRLKRTRIEKSAQFQIGEQRFSVRIL